VIEQEPGSASLIMIHQFVKLLAGFSVVGKKPEGSKEVRAEALAAQVEHGFVYIFNDGQNNAWINPMLDEYEQFPGGKFMDQVDAGSGAFGELTFTSSRTGCISRANGMHIGYKPR
jgi:predicted phage terminase large subunit-like protein